MTGCAAGSLIFCAANITRAICELAGTKLDQAALASAFGQEDWDRVEGLITDDVLRGHCASGTPAQALEALSAYRMAGLDEIVVYGVQEREQVADVLAIMRPE